METLAAQDPVAQAIGWMALIMAGGLVALLPGALLVVLWAWQRGRKRK